MKRLVFILFISIFIISVSGCTFLGKQIGSNNVKIEYQNMDMSNASADINVQIPVLDNISDSEFKESMNKYFLDYITNSANEFTHIAEEFAKDIPEGKKAYLNIDCHDEYNDREFLSMIITIETYTGGVHSIVNSTSVNIDLQNKQVIGLSELFKPDSEYKKTLNKIMTDITAENTDLYGELWEMPMIDDNTENCFYLKDNSLVIYYQPYELASYGRGFVEFSIPLEILKPYLNENFHRFIEAS